MEAESELDWCYSFSRIPEAIRAVGCQSGSIMSVDQYYNYPGSISDRRISWMARSALKSLDGPDASQAWPTPWRAW